MFEFEKMKYLRNDLRATIHTTAEIMIDGIWHNCRIINISTGGAKLQMDLHLGCGIAASLQIGKFGQFNSTVVWRHKEEVGVRFAHDDASEVAGVIMGLASYG